MCLWVSTPTTTLGPERWCAILVVTAFPFRRWSRSGTVGREGQDCDGNCSRNQAPIRSLPVRPTRNYKPPRRLTGQQPGHEVNRKQESNQHDGLHIITIERVADRADRGEHLVVVEDLSEVVGRVLRPGIGIKD